MAVEGSLLDESIRKRRIKNKHAWLKKTDYEYFPERAIQLRVSTPPDCDCKTHPPPVSPPAASLSPSAPAETVSTRGITPSQTRGRPRNYPI